MMSIRQSSLILLRCCKYGCATDVGNGCATGVGNGCAAGVGNGCTTGVGNGCVTGVGNGCGAANTEMPNDTY